MNSKQLAIGATTIVVIFTLGVSLFNSFNNNKLNGKLNSLESKLDKLTTTPANPSPTLALTPTPVKVTDDVKPIDPGIKLEELPQTQNISLKIYFGRATATDYEIKSFTRQASTNNVANFLMEEYFKGPNDAEAAQGFRRNFDLIGDSLCPDKARNVYVEIKNGAAIVTSCKKIMGIGDMSDGLAEVAIAKTLKQFNSVKKVAVRNYDGSCTSFNATGIESIPCEINVKEGGN